MLYGILLLAAGLMMLAKPEIFAKNPKAKSPKVIRILGGVVTVCGLLVLVLSLPA